MVSPLYRRTRRGFRRSCGRVGTAGARRRIVVLSERPLVPSLPGSCARGSGRVATGSASVEFDHGAPFFFFVASALVILPFLLASFGLLPGARIDLSRSVLVHAAS